MLTYKGFEIQVYFGELISKKWLWTGGKNEEDAGCYHDETFLSPDSGARAHP